MTKRIIALFLVCILAIPLLAVPASALTSDPDYSDWENQIINEVQTIQIWLEDVCEVKIEEMRQTLNTLLFAFDEFLTEFREKYQSDQLFKGVLDGYLESIDNNISTLAADIWSEIGTTLTSIKDNVTNIFGQLTFLYNDLDDWITEQTATITAKFSTSLSTHLGTLYNNVSDKLDVLFGDWYFYLGDWFWQLFDKLDTLISGSSEDQTAADDFNNQISTEATEFDESMSAIQEATRPEIEDINLNVDGYVNAYAVGAYTDVFASIFKNSIFYAVFFLAFTFSLVSYALFGKR